MKNKNKKELDWCSDEACQMFTPGGDHTKGCVSLCKYTKKKEENE